MENGECGISRDGILSLPVVKFGNPERGELRTEAFECWHGYATHMKKLPSLEHEVDFSKVVKLTIQGQYVMPVIRETSM